ncbi:hypothetical protein ACS0TY_035891 [Phlomoides rotata]
MLYGCVCSSHIGCEQRVEKTCLCYICCPTSVGSEGGKPSLGYIRSLGVFVTNTPNHTL